MCKAGRSVVNADNNREDDRPLRILDGGGLLFAYRTNRPQLSAEALPLLRKAIPKFVATCLKTWKIAGNTQRGDHFYSILGMDRQAKQASLVLATQGGHTKAVISGTQNFGLSCKA